MTDIEHLYRDNHRLYLNIIRQKVSDTSVAEDVLQEAYYRAVKFYPSYDPERGSLSKWFNKIMYNALRDEYCKDKVGLAKDVADCKPEDVIEDIYNLSQDKREFLYSNLNRVANKKHKRILYLFFVLGYSSSEICMIEDSVTQSNVTTVVNRFKESLKKDVRI